MLLCCVSQAFGSCSHPGAVSQEERATRDGGERDPEHQETLGQNGLQRPPQFQDNGTCCAIYQISVAKLQMYWFEVSVHALIKQLLGTLLAGVFLNLRQSQASCFTGFQSSR